jgi:hypothetical protein
MSETLESLLRMALAEPAVSTPPTAFVLPTTRGVLARLAPAAAAGAIRMCGVEARGAAPPATILGELREGVRPGVVVVFEDQLAGPAHATLLVRRAEGAVHVSPVGFILADAYGYRLAVWCRDRNRILDGPQPIDTVAAATVAHLESCRRLGAEWSCRDAQEQREPALRRTAALRKLRYLRSCVANAFMARPDSTDCHGFMARIASLEACLVQADTP